MLAALDGANISMLTGAQCTAATKDNLHYQ